MNELTVETGNPFLRPQYTNSLQLTHTFNYSINTTLKVSHTKDMMTKFTDIKSENEQIFTWDNLASQKSISLNISAPYQVTEWWQTYSNLTASILKNEADFGEGKVVDLTTPALQFFTQHKFRLPGKISLEISGQCMTGGIWGGNITMGPMWGMDAGLKRKFFNNKGVLKIALDDVFKTQKWNAEANLGELQITGNGGRDSRRLKVSYTHNFGNQKVKSRNRNTGAEEEAGRAGE